MWSLKLLDLLDNAHRQLIANEGFSAFALLQAPLRDLYLYSVAEGSGADFIATTRSHPLYWVAQEDPFTKRCNDKPRGYPGDAVMLDYVYSRTAPKDVTVLGQHWFDFTTVGSMSLSVRFRRSLLQAMIDDVVARNAGYQILSVASGHCRELDTSLVLSDRFSGDFVALDQDAESCAFVAAEYAARSSGRIKVRNQSVKTILKSGLENGQDRFHLIYSAGLFDYLEQRTAIALTSALLKMLRSGGKLVIANFVPESESRGYAAAFMDWHLIYRTPAELAAVFGDLSGRISMQLDPHRNVAYASYTRPLSLAAQ